MDILFQDLPSGVSFEMLPVEGGIFQMGDEIGDLSDGCRPVHDVKLSDFHIGKYPVTQAVWKAVIGGDNPSRFPGEDRPAERVSWDEITQKFLPKLQQMTGRKYRLPTEAEWEYAARGGKYHAEGYKYAGSDRLKDVGWFTENSNNETKPVGQKYPNQLGIHEMSGNVYEWCNDRYGANEYYDACKNSGLVEDPIGPEKGTARVLRGGGWGNDALRCRTAYRYFGGPGNRDLGIGFRLALVLQ